MKRTSTLLVRSLLSASGVTVLAAGVYAQAPAMDGTLDTLIYGAPLVVQNTQTGFGSSNLGQIGNANGSELNAGYAKVDGDTLYLFLSGNLESNGNRIWIFLDTRPGGQNRLRGDNAGNIVNMGDLSGANGLQFDTGFEADFAYELNCNGGTNLFVDSYRITSGLFPGTSSYLGAASVGGNGVLAGGTNPGGLRFTLNNSNVGGVPAGSGTDAGSGASVNTGVEVAIPLSSIDWPVGAVRFTVFITSGSSDFVSNQVLGGIGGGGNLGSPRGSLSRVDFSAIPGNQFFGVDLPAPRLAALRIGNGAFTLSGAAFPVYVDEFSSTTLAQGSSIQTLEMPTVPASSGNRALTMSGSATTEGMLTRSRDGRFLTLQGYNAAVGASSVSSSSAGTINRVVGRIDRNGIVDTSTSSSSAHTGGSLRSSVSSDGTDIWTGGAGSSSGGVNKWTFGSSTTSSVNGTNSRVVNIFNDQLYSSASINVFANGIGLPTTSVFQTGNLTVSGANIQDFFFADANTIYLTEESSTTIGIRKYTWNGTSWIASGNFSSGLPTSSRTTGICGYKNAQGEVVLFVAYNRSSPASSGIARLVDTGPTSEFSVLHQVGSNQVFRGVDFSVLPPPNLSPTANNDSYIGTEDTTLTVDAANGVIANDSDDGPIGNLTASLVSTTTSGTLTFNSDGSFTYVPFPDFNGQDSFAYKVNDGNSDSGNANVTITVNGTNDDPILNSIGDKDVDESSVLTFGLSASDVDLDTLTYSADILPAGATLVGNVFSWTPTEAQGPGTYPITFTVSDGNGGTDSEAITITVNEVNAAPAWATIPAQSAAENAAFSVDVSSFASDGDAPANSLTFSKVGGPAGLTISAAGLVEWTPGETDGGTAPTVTVRATDNGNLILFTDTTFTINVDEVNAPPTLAAIPNQTVEAGQLLTFTAVGDDPNDDPENGLTYSLSGAPAGMSINPSTGVVSWTPTLAQGPLVYNFSVVVTDDGAPNLQATQPVQVTVTVSNTAPTLDPIGNQSVFEDQLLTFDASATDPDNGQTLTYSLGAGAPNGAYINPSNGEFTFRPASIQTPNNFTVTVIVDDGNGGTDSETITINAQRETRTANPLYGWGYNGTGALALGDQVDRNSPTVVPALTNVSRIFGVGYNAFARDPLGGWHGWGFNFFGQLGNGRFDVPYILVPESLPNLAGIVDLGGGEYHSVGLMGDGTFKSWGINSNGQLGLGYTSLGINTPQVIPSTSNGFNVGKGIGSAYSHLVLNTGAGLAMGRNDVGQLGIGTTGANQLSPTATNVTSGLRSISTGANHVLALRDDLTVWSTGDNAYGQLGTGSFTSQSSFAQVPGLSDVVRISAGKEASYAVRRDGTVWAWGRNLLGKLGDGTTNTSNVPVQVSGLTDVKEVFATEESAIALKNDGTVWAWGSNQYGMLGDGTTGGSSTVPVQVPGLTGIDRVRTIGNAVFAWKYGAPNAAPVAEDDTYSVNEDQVLTVNAASGVIANDTDDQPISGLVASLVSAPNPAQGSVVLNPDGSFTFTPAANFNGAATFTYKVNDWQLDSNTATVTINVAPVNDDPVLDSIGARTVDELTPLSITLTSSDIDGGTPVYSASNLPAGANFAGDTFTWTPTEAQGPGSYDVTFSVSDGNGGTDSEVVTITVNEVNVAPELTAIGPKSVNELSELSFTIGATDGDLPANTLSYSATGLPSGASFSGNTFTWTPTETQGPGSYDVTFIVNDGAGGTDSEVVTITVNEVNTAPVANNQTVNATEDTALPILLTANDADNDPLTWSYSQPSHGVVTGTAPNVTYTPNANFAGTDSFTFTVNDGQENSNVATVTVNVVDVLDMEVTVVGSVAPNAFGSPSFGAYAARAMTSLENNPGVDDGDRTVDPTAYDAVTQIPWYDNAATGTPFWMGVQNPAAPFNLELGHRIHFGVRFLGKGTRFSLSQLDFEWFSSDNNSLGFTDSWSAADVYTQNRRGIDYGADRVKGTMDDVVIITGPADQMVDELIYLGYGNAWDVTQEPGATVADQLASLRCYLEQEAPITIQGTYKVRDGNGGFLGEGTGTVSLVPTNTLPVAAHQTVGVNEDESVAITLSAVDTDPFEAPLGYMVVDGPAHGTLSGVEPNLIYTPNPNYFGPDSFTFKATDCVGESNIATVTINVASVNDDPVLDAVGSRTVDELVPLVITLNSSDIDGGSAVYSATGMPVGAGIAGNTFTWTPSENQGPGSYDVTFTVNDGNGGSDSETITITVNEVNVAPELDPIGDRTVGEMSELSFSASATDSDLPANTLTYSLVGAPSGATINPATGAFTWTPTEAQGPAGYTFTIKVSDGLLTDEEEITVTVNEVNVAPTLDPIGNQMVNELDALTFTATATDSDLPANTLTFSLVGAPSGATIDGTSGAFSWTPTEAQGPNVYSFTVRVSDGDLTHDEVITVTVNEVNTPPIANAQTLGTGINQGLNITLSGSDTDIPVQTLTYQVVSGPTNGILSGVEPNLIYTPNPGYSGPDSFTFKANDGVADSSVETITINVSGLAILLDLQFQGFQSSAPVTRGVSITFGGLSGSGNLPVTLDRDLVISQTGQASLVLTNADIPNLQPNEGNYGISVKDNLHTLRKTQQLTWTGTGYAANIVLTGGNLNKDGKIDIGDYIVYAVRLGTPVDPNTPLALQANPSFRHADISGDGIVDAIDFSFISAGFGTIFDDPLVGEYGRGDDPVRTRMTVAEAIRESGSNSAAQMDLNRDGWISLAEIQACLFRKR